MPSVQATAQVEATPEEIFAFLSDYENIPLLQPQFQSAHLVSEHAQGVGAVVELKGHFHGMPMSVRNRIITYTPPYRMVSISEGTVLSRNTWELRPVDGAAQPTTEVTFTVEYKLGGPLGGLFTGITSSLFHSEVQALTEASLRRLHEAFSNDAKRETDV
jgi:ribosome-associated toxin RatA of RatAB toxin-antitoxin module